MPIPRIAGCVVTLRMSARRAAEEAIQPVALKKEPVHFSGVVQLKNLLELEGNHALEGQHCHLGKDAFPGEEIAEVTATVSVLRCFCFHRLGRINF